MITAVAVMLLAGLLRIVGWIRAGVPKLLHAMAPTLKTTGLEAAGVSREWVEYQF